MPEPDLSRRQACALGAAAWISPGRAATAVSANVLDHGADPSGQRDSTAAFLAAMAQARRVLVPAGDFLCQRLDLPAGLVLEGVGERSVLRQAPDAPHLLHVDSGSADPAKNLEGIVLRGLQLRGRCDSLGFSEFVHLASLNGVSDLLVEDVVFRGFRGDGLYLGSSATAGRERHNRRVLVRRCTFDGINQDNRNGLSIIDGEDVRIEDCVFTRLSRRDMPGAVDIEPDGHPWHVVRRIALRRNRFVDVGGGIGAMCLYVPVPLTTPVTDIVFEDNEVQGAQGSAFSLMLGPGAAAGGGGLRMQGNRAGGALGRPFVLRGLEGASLLDNRFEGARESALLGWRSPDSAVRSVLLRQNLFRGCGWRGGVGLSVFHAQDLRFEDNEFNDCGNGTPTAYAVDFNEGRSERVVFTGNRFLSPTGRTRWAIQREASHRFMARENRFGPDNLVGHGLRSAFEAPT